ncbi:MAG: DMT family transporter [Suipraeoptans sp.]
MSKLTNKTKAIVASVLGNFIFGLSFLASKIALSEVSPMVLISTRFILSFLIMNLLVFFGIAKINFRGKNLFPLLILGICQPVLYFIFETYGIKYSSSSFAGIIIAFIPILAFLLAAVFLKEPLKKNKVVWSIFSLVGIVIISLAEQSGGSVHIIGILLLSGAVLTAAIFNIISRKNAGTFTAFERTYFMFAVASIVFFIMALFETKGTLFRVIAEEASNISFVLPTIFLAVFSSVIAFFCVNYSVTYLRIQQSTSFGNLSTIVSVVAGVLILHENFTVFHLFGIVLIIIGVYKVNSQ